MSEEIKAELYTTLAGEGSDEFEERRSLFIGHAKHVTSEEEAQERFEAGQILCIPRPSSAILPLLKSAAGIITEESDPDCHAAIVGMALDIPVIIGAQNATLILKSGTAVTMDAEKGTVSSGEEE